MITKRITTPYQLRNGRDRDYLDAVISRNKVSGVPSGGITAPSATTLEALTDVVIDSTVSSGQYLQWNGTNWVNASGAQVSALADLSDVTISTLVVDDFLRWNGTYWVPDHGDDLAYVDEDNTFVGNQTIEGALSLVGNLTQSGGSIATLETIQTSEDLITLRYNNGAALGAGEISGFVAHEADASNDYVIGFTNDGLARSGLLTGTPKRIANIIDSPDADGVAVWDNSNSRLYTPYTVDEFARKAENATITGAWTFTNSIVFDTFVSIGTTATDELLTVDGNVQAVEGIYSSHVQVGGDLSVDVDADITGQLTQYAEAFFDNDLQSLSTFKSGFAGENWMLESTTGQTRLTVDFLTVRKGMDIYELVVNQIRGTNGALLVSDTAKVHSAAILSGSDWEIYFDTSNQDLSFVPFVSNDIIVCQKFTNPDTKYYKAQVTSGPVAYGTDGLVVIVVTITEGTDTPGSGDVVGRVNNTVDTARMGYVYITSSDNESPYIDIVFNDVVKTRLGNLYGISDADFGGQLSGYGLYSDNVYLKGELVVTGGTASNSAATRNYADVTAAYETGLLEDDLNAILDDAVTYGTTIITGGHIDTSLLDADVVRSTVITTTFIEAQSFDFVQGTIGGWNIGGSTIYQDKIVIDSTGEIRVKDDTRGAFGTFIGDFELTDASNYFTIDDTTNGSISYNTGTGISQETDVSAWINGGYYYQHSSANVTTNLVVGADYTVYLSGNISFTVNAQSGYSDYRVVLENWEYHIYLRCGGQLVHQEVAAQNDVLSYGQTYDIDFSMNDPVTFEATNSNLEIEVYLTGAPTYGQHYSTGSWYTDELDINIGNNTFNKIIVKNAGRNEISARGLQLIWADNKYLKVKDSFSGGWFIQGQGEMELLSPNGSHGIRITDSGVSQIGTWS